ncbi:hypothetical protein Bca52824_074650 [Brassica carinata]|uniref:Uncharacterized protein n=1 Tax=Brassica carinata TaxID=52824 RepID=A0A8X7PNX9_BRACI|nr:hypothetical protein Bca52824_074650 [Brassica carinata]
MKSSFPSTEETPRQGREPHRHNPTTTETKWRIEERKPDLLPTLKADHPRATLLQPRTSKEHEDPPEKTNLAHRKLTGDRTQTQRRRARRRDRTRHDRKQKENEREEEGAPPVPDAHSRGAGPEEKVRSDFDDFLWLQKTYRGTLSLCQWF